MEEYLLKSGLGLILTWKVSMPNKETLEYILFKYRTESHTNNDRF
jgi:hypothetical protein